MSAPADHTVPRQLLLAAGLAAAGAAAPALAVGHALVEVARHQRTSAPAPARPLGQETSVEVIVPAYLEASTIGPKVRQLRTDLSGRANARITVAASDDPTARAAHAAGADRVLQGERRGKAHAVNQAVSGSSADVVVLTDANCRIEPADWVDTLLDELSRWDLLSANKFETGGGEGLFWRLERDLKRRTQAIGTLAVVGEFLAFRREDYRPVPEGTVLDDFWIARDFATRGLRVGVSEFIGTTEDAVAADEQWERRVRIGAAVLREAVPRVPELLGSPAGRVHVTHKLYRMTIGPALFWTGLAMGAARSPVAAGLLATVVVRAFLGYSGRADVRTGTLSTVLGMQLVPVAALARVVRRALGRSDAMPGTWRKVPR